jgi:hypothetical protein
MFGQFLAYPQSHCRHIVSERRGNNAASEGVEMDKKKRLWDFLLVGAVIVAGLVAVGIKGTQT